MRKIRRFVDFVNMNIIVFIDHDSTLENVKQVTLSTSSIDRLNLRLICVLDCIQRFNLMIKHKSKKLHIISDALSRLLS